ncbi:MAG: hypothetical protein IT168_04950 [Bryobacterales bacterium]|nr:hypothetical protein [Bryobacterales bacterium]
MPKANFSVSLLIATENGLHTYLSRMQLIGRLNENDTRALLEHLLYQDSEPFDSLGNFQPAAVPQRNVLKDAILDSVDYAKLIRSPELFEISQTVNAAVLLSECGRGCPGSSVPVTLTFFDHLKFQVGKETYSVSPPTNP